MVETIYCHALWPCKPRMHVTWLRGSTARSSSSPLCLTIFPSLLPSLSLSSSFLPLSHFSLDHCFFSSASHLLFSSPITPSPLFSSLLLPFLSNSPLVHPSSSPLIDYAWPTHHHCHHHLPIPILCPSRSLTTPTTSSRFHNGFILPSFPLNLSFWWSSLVRSRLDVCSSTSTLF